MNVRVHLTVISEEQLYDESIRVRLTVISGSAFILKSVFWKKLGVAKFFF